MGAHLTPGAVPGAGPRRRPKPKIEYGSGVPTGSRPPDLPMLGACREAERERAAYFAWLQKRGPKPPPARYGHLWPEQRQQSGPHPGRPPQR